MAEPEELPASANPLSFIFGGNTGTPTYAELQRRRAIATALASRRMPAPKTVGEGMTYLGESLANIAQQWALDKSERAYDAESAKLAIKPPADETTPPPIVAPRAATPPPSTPTAGNVPVMAQGGNEGGDGDLRAQIAQTLQDREQPPPQQAPVQLAALNTGATMSDALPPGAERMVAQDQSNPPIVTGDIKPMRMAQAPPPAVDPSRVIGTENIKPYVPPEVRDPGQPKRAPYTADFYTGRELLARHPDPNDPHHIRAQSMLQRDAETRKFIDDRNITKYNADVAEANRQRQERERLISTQQERQTAEQSAARANVTAQERVRGFGSEAAYADAVKGLEASHKDVQHIPNAAIAINNAMELLNKDPKMFTGQLADVQQSWAKFVRALGGSFDDRIIGTEKFKPYLTDILAQLRPAIVSSGAQSNAEFKRLELAAASDNKLERESIAGILHSIAERNVADATRHQARFEDFAARSPAERGSKAPYLSLPMENVVQPEAVRELRSLVEQAKTPEEASAVIKDFDGAYKTPGLAKRMLSIRR